MALYEYKGLNRKGKTVRGTVNADNQRSARAQLKKEGVFIQSLKDKTKKKKGKKQGSHANAKVSIDDMAMYTRQLATLIRANIPLVECLNGVADQTENQVLKDVTREIKDSVNEGISLAKAMQRYPNIFSKIFVSMVEAGEASGTLDVILLRLTEFTESQNELQSKLKSAMMYPFIMLGFTLILLIVMNVWMIPKIIVIFEEFPDLVLPWYSKAVIDMSNFMIDYWIMILASLFGVSFLFKKWKSTPSGSDQFDAMSLKVPFFGKLTRMVAVSRFTKTLSTLLTGGVPMLQALDIVKNVIDNAVLERAVIKARDNISEGETIATPLKKSGEFPPIVIHMIAIGEKTGELENMLEQISDSYDFQVKTKIDGLTSVLEPVMIIMLGGMIGAIILAIMVPLLEISNISG
jgi:general secretion pathway protein F